MTICEGGSIKTTAGLSQLIRMGILPWGLTPQAWHEPLPIRKDAMR